MSRFVACIVVVVLGCWLAWFGFDADQPKTERPRWTTGTITGSPEVAPAFKLTNPFPNLKFDHPLQFVHLPGTDRLFVVEQGGKIFTFRNNAAAKAEVFFDPAKELKSWKAVPKAAEFEGSFALVFHPKFAENRTCFVCYTVKGKNIPNLTDGSRLSRFKVTDNFRIDPASEELLLSFKQGGHNGCDLHFGPDGFLYVSSGDAADPNPPDTFRTGQDLTDLEASVLRIDVDRRDAGRSYAIPSDNPFVGLKIGDKTARGEIWAYGFRNAWRMSFDRGTGQLWVGDVGWELWELVHKVGRGHNGGWSIMEGPQAVNTTWPVGPTAVIRPAIEVPHSEGASMTGGYVYRGKKFPKLVGHYIFGDWVTKRIWSADVSTGDPAAKVEMMKPTARVVAFGEDAAGEIFVVDYDEGTILTLAADDAATYDPAKFPRTLSATGLFADSAKHTLAPGVRPFEINAHTWQDYSTAEYFLALPGDGVITDYPERKRLPNNVSWHWARFHFPKDAVLVKTISLEMAKGNPQSSRRIETQVMHFDGEMWAGYTYAWRDDQTDADLVPADGAERRFTVADPVFANGKREQTWTYFGRSQCVQCHHSWAEYTLAFNLEQLNRTMDAKPTREHQLLALLNEGYLERRGKDEKPLPAYKLDELAKDRKLADPHDASAKLDDRAKAYFQVNCGHCHRFGGGGGVDFELHGFCDLKNKKLLDALPMRGTLDLDDARLIAPGDKHRSTVYARMAKFGSGRMPHIGSEFVDESGLELIGRWIDSQGKPTTTTLTERCGKAAECMVAARALASGKLGERKKPILEAAAKLPPGTKRDFFEGFLPHDGERKLGANPRPRSILALAGNADRGKELFAAEKLQCTKCHQIAGKGVNLGPDLTTIGKTRSQELLLESLLEPSKRIDQLYVSYVVVTIDGKSFTGIQVKKTDASVTIRQADGTEVVVPTSDIESLKPARESMMPAGLLADLTPQQAADLVEFLLRLK